MINSLELQPAKRQGGPNKLNINYLDYIISGESLVKILDLRDCDFITSLDFEENSDFRNDILKTLMLLKVSTLKSGRVMLYVCPECKDIGCGAITANIKEIGDKIVWQDFGYETGSEGLIEAYNTEPIKFKKLSYLKTLITASENLSSK